MPSTKPIASVSLDLDDKWTYMKTHGDSRWSTFPSYLGTVVPRVLNFLAERNLTISFFIVGQDAALSSNQAVLGSIAARGHEIANHSFHHEPWLHLYSRPQIEEEIAQADAAIERATGSKPIGFRGPGFSISEDVLEVLLARGYRYDASTLPTFIGPLARYYYFLTAKLDPKEREKRALLFGKWRDGLRPLRLHQWRIPSGSLLELPVTTIPVIKTPFHLSYLLYLSAYSTTLSMLYLRLAISLCRLTGVQPSFLLHPLDFAAPEDAPELKFFPGMQLSLAHKLSIANKSLDMLAESFRLAPIRSHIDEVAVGLAPSAAQVVSS